MTETHLSLHNLSKVFRLGAYEIRAVNSLTVSIDRGECLAIVGESGSGKSTVANMILGLLEPTAGTIELSGDPLLLSRTLQYRRRIQLVQQNPYSSINPSRHVGASLRLPLDVHDIGVPVKRWQRARELLEEVGLPGEFVTRSPTTLSGGQGQRVAIARALACQPELLVLDEPTSSLDVLVQARILQLLRNLLAARNLTYIFITHDLAVVRNMADRVAVMKEGEMVELGRTEAIFTNPSHPYTRKLISASPVITAEEQELRAFLQKGSSEMKRPCQSLSGL